MRWQTTAVFAVLLVALGSFYYFYEVRWAPGREEAEARKGRVFAAEVADVTEVTLKRREDAVRLVRDGKAWQMTEPVTARGSRPAVEEALATLLTAKIDREIDPNPASVADFGLDAPAAEVTLTLKDGKTLGLSLGARNPTGVWVYAREKGKPAVFVVPESVLRDSTRSVADFRDRTVLAYDVKDVTGLEVVTADQTLVVEGADGTWTLTRPVSLPADRETVTELLDKLAGMKVKDFVAESPRSREPFGLERPVRLTVHTGRDQERASRSLLVGRLDAGKQGVYAMRPGESSVLLLPPEIATLVPRNVAVLRDRVVVDVDRDKLARLEVESPKGTVTLAREDGQWKIVAPEALPADQVEVGAVLSRVRELRAQGFLADDAAGIPRFLGKPQVRVSLTEEGASGPTTLLLASSRDTRGGAPSAYAAVAGRGPVVLVEARALDDLARSVTDLRDRRLLAGLEPRDVKRVRMQAGGQSVLLERSGDTAWRLVEPAKRPAKGGKVDDLLYSLRALKWKAIAAPGGDNPARYGLDTPSLELVLYREDGGELATVQVGTREGEQAFVRTKAGPAIYSVDPRQLGDPLKVPEDLEG